MSGFGKLSKFKYNKSLTAEKKSLVPSPTAKNSNDDLKAKEEKWKKEVRGVIDELHKQNKEKDSTIRFLKDKLQEADKSHANITEKDVVKNLESRVESLEKKVEEKEHVIRNLQKSIVSVGTSKRSGDTSSADKEKDRLLQQFLGHSNNRSNESSINLAPPKQDKDRFGISAEAFTASKLKKASAKTQEDRLFISKCLEKTTFLKGLDSKQINELIECMHLEKASAGKEVIKQGDFGKEMYLIKKGQVDVFVEKNGKQNHVFVLEKGGIFGELAILYGCKRTATCKIKTEAELWVIDRQSFQTIVKHLGQERLDEYVKLLKTVDKLKELPNGTLMRMADCFEPQKFHKGDYIIRQNENGDCFFVIRDGKVKITKNKGKGEELLVNLGKGDFFGERALLTEDKRSANVIADSSEVDCLLLDRTNFTNLIGDINELGRTRKSTKSLERINQEQEKEFIEIMKTLRTNEEKNFKVLTPNHDDVALIQNATLHSLQMLTVLGQGGFGFVKLCKVSGIDKSSFALKSIKKAKIVKQGQQQHVVAERSIQMSLKSPFTGKLYKTFKDETRVYMLMDAYLGGELYGVLRKVGPLKDGAARFCAACTLEALAYLHEKGIVYRDLKPENLMVDHKGYIILIDFGFAKKLKEGSKTWTFCGTPEYFPPEVLSNAGHDISADYWSFGILIYELLTMTTPFYAQDDMLVYEKILGGIERVRFSPKVKKHAEALVRSLCKLEPRERMGNLRGGVNDIRKSRWFQSFDWHGLQQCRLDSPFDPDVSGPLDVKHFPKVSGHEGDKDTSEDRRLIAQANMKWDEVFG